MTLPSAPPAEAEQPLLSISIPTYNRPEMLTRALRSVTTTPVALQPHTELIVSDNSTDKRSEFVYTQWTSEWQGPTTYRRNLDSPGMVGNFNRCIETASGRFVLILHDDDYLRPGAVSDLHAALSATSDERALLFGVCVVDNSGRKLRSQTYRSRRHLPPAAAVRRVLRHSSFVRFPAIVVRRDAYLEAGGFDAYFGGQTDFDMWTRLFARHGVQCEPSVTACYVVHEEGDTSGVFVAETLERVNHVFRWAKEQRLLPVETIRRCKADWLHQFILGGTYRRLRARDTAGAREVLRLFDHPIVRAAGRSPRWLAVRVAFQAAARYLPLD